MPQDFVKRPQWIEETTEGSTPTTGSYTAIAPTAYFGLTSDKSVVPIMSLGTRDPAKILEGRNITGFTLRSNPCDVTFPKYAFNLAGGTGTIEKTLAFASQITIGGTTYYFTANHCRVASCTITGAPGSPLLLESYVLCKSPTLSLVAPDPTMSTASGTPLMFYSGGSDPITYGSTVIDCRSISVRVDNNIGPIWVMGNKNYKQVPPGGRDFSVAFSNVFRDPTKLWTDYGAYTPRTFTWTMDSSGPKKFTLTNANLVSLRDLSFDVADLSVMGRYGRGGGPVEEMYMAFSESIALTSS